MNLGSNTLIPIYDNEDSVCGIIYNDEPYYFQKNLQGDIVGIVDKDAKVVAKYSYDAWGVCTVTSDNSNVGIANVNMFRYRGYYYDFEIGMYYLWSRYFDPSIGRFINSDNPDIFVLYSVIENNLYTYCLNNPINNRDEKGRLATWIVKKIVSVILGVFVGLTQQFLSDVFLSAYNRKFSISSLGTYGDIRSLRKFLNFNSRISSVQLEMRGFSFFTRTIGVRVILYNSHTAENTRREHKNGRYADCSGAARTEASDIGT